MSDFWSHAEIISSYSRAQAIADGVLADISAIRPLLVKEAGIKFPVAMTSAAFAKVVAPILGADEVESSTQSLPPCQDFEGRLWDVLNLLRWAIRRSTGGDTVRFVVRVYRQKGYEGAKRTGVEVVNLKAICGPGDDAEPVITIMLPEED